MFYVARFVPKSQTELVIGRKNGLVECHKFPDSLSCPNTEPPLRRFHMPSKVVIAAPISEDRLVCLCEGGEGIIVYWDEELWMRENQKRRRGESRGTIRTDNEWASFRSSDFPSVAFKIHQGVKAKSDGAAPDVPVEVVPSVPFYDVCMEGVERPLWLDRLFRVPGPVHCAALSDADRSKLAFGGSNNLVKVVDLNRLCAVFSAKNKDSDCLGLTDPIEVTSVAFLNLLGENSTVLGVGTKRGRLQIYDQKTHNKPVLEVAVCHNQRSVLSLEVSPTYSCQSKVNHCCELDETTNGCNESSNRRADSPDQNKESNKKCLVWSNNGLSSPLRRGKSAVQSIVIGDNHGEVYIYDIMATRKTKAELQPTEETSPEPPNKKRKWQPYKYGQYERGSVVVPLAQISDTKYELKAVHNVPFAMGGITGESV